MIEFVEKNKKIIGIIVGICIVVIVFLMYWFRNPFVNEYKIEAGDEIKISDLLKDESARNPKIITSLDETIINKVGLHEIKAKANDREFTIKINVEDTIPPKVTTQTYHYFIGDKFNASHFIKEVIDMTKVTATMEDQVDLSKEGSHKVTVIFSDEGNNQVKKNVKLIVKKDTEAPIITAPHSITVIKGDTVLYKKDVKVNDNRDGEITDYDIDSSKVNLSKVGSYYVTYSAKDKAGNKNSKKVLIVVTSKEAAQAKQEAQKYAKNILKKIINDSMNNAQKLKAIYNYVRENYKYTAQHEGTIDDYYIDALNGFKTGRGDCYVVNAMARFLLDEVGIESYGLVLHGSDMNHISFMVNLGDGWYHYCAFKKKSGIQIFKWTDQQMIDHYAFCGIKSIPSTVPKTPTK